MRMGSSICQRQECGGRYPVDGEAVQPACNVERSGFEEKEKLN